MKYPFRFPISDPVARLALFYHRAVLITQLEALKAAAGGEARDIGKTLYELGAEHVSLCPRGHLCMRHHPLHPLDTIGTAKALSHLQSLPIPPCHPPAGNRLAVPSGVLHVPPCHHPPAPAHLASPPRGSSALLQRAQFEEEDAAEGEGKGPQPMSLQLASVDGLTKGYDYPV